MARSDGKDAFNALRYCGECHANKDYHNGTHRDEPGPQEGVAGQLLVVPADCDFLRGPAMGSTLWLPRRRWATDRQPFY